jgi:hypothetical protein
MLDSISGLGAPILVLLVSLARTFDHSYSSYTR